jgi:propionate CoA-transferase
MKIVSADEAVADISTEQNLIVSGNGEVLLPDELLAALERRFLTTSEPRELTLLYNVIPGSPRAGTGVDRFAHPGMLRHVLAGSYYTLRVGKLNDLVTADEVEAHLVPYGALYNMVRCAAAAQPGVLTQVGIGTFVDPRIGGARLNPRTTSDVSRVLEIDGTEYLFYTAPRIDVAILRATTADEDGNLTLEHEPQTLGLLHQAMAAKNSGGTVIVQVQNVARRGSLHPRSVVVPGVFVDRVVHVPDQMAAQPYNPAWTGDLKVPVDDDLRVPLDARKVIGRRAAMELKPGDLVNFGFGVGATVPQIAAEEGIAEQVLFNVEHGPVGGVPSGKEGFGTAVSPAVIMDAPAIFDFYDAGRLDMTCLGAAEIDADGNVNVSLVGGRYNLGGFLDIVHRTRRIVFCGTFTAGGLEVDVNGSGLSIVREGKHRKFVHRVGQISFNGRAAVQKGQEVLYVTERAVFRLTRDGIALVEVASGVDLQTQVLDQMDFRPVLPAEPVTMDPRLFAPGRMGLASSGPFAPDGAPRGE